MLCVVVVWLVSFPDPHTIHTGGLIDGLGTRPHCGTLVVWLDYNKTGVWFYTTSFHLGMGVRSLEIVTSQACDILCQDYVCS